MPKILIVDDSALVRKTLRRHLERQGFELAEAEDGERAMEQIAAFDPDLVLLDVMMPKLDGFEVARRVKADPKFRHLYIIMLTARRENEDEISGLDVGADDYVTKPFNAGTLLARIRRGLSVSQERTAGVLDGLTRLYNRRVFYEFLAREQARSLRTGQPLAFIMADIDHFKAVNDTFGHQAGDDVLRELAALLRQGGRAMDLPARLGGEEFGLLLPGTPLAGAAQVAERLRATVEAHAFAGVGRLSISLGVAQYRGEEHDIVEDADKAMYRAKHKGRNRVELAAGA